MDFAVFLGDEKTIIFKRMQGIVLNEPTRIMYTIQKSPKKKKEKETKIIAVGKDALKLEQKKLISDNTDEVKTIFESTVKNGRIENSHLAGHMFSEFYKKVTAHSTSQKRRCLFAIPSSITVDELNEYKTAIFAAGVSDAVFVPAVVTSAAGLGFNIESREAFMSIVVEDGWTDICVIKCCEVIAGGSVEKFNNKKLVDAINTVITGLDANLAEEVLSNGIHIGGRKVSREFKEFLLSNLKRTVVIGDKSFNSVIEGAGMLLNDEQLIKKIIDVN